MPDAPASSDIRDLVRHARDEAGLTQEELAEQVGMSQRWVSALERGEVVQPRLPTLHRLAGALRLDLTDLIIAAKLASTKAEARRIAQEVPVPLPDNDPKRRLVRLLEEVRLNDERVGLLEGIMRQMIEFDRKQGRSGGT